MYEKVTGGTSVNIQGLMCNLPPVGKVYNRFTKQVEDRGVFKASEVRSGQRWVVPDKPANIKKALREEAKKRKENPRYFDTELQEYREREWDRRVNGFWFYIKGSPTYITGQHYFMLAHWTIEGNHPDYRDTDREWHYFWEYCWNDPECFGMLEINRRRDGKSVRAGNAIYHRTSMATEKKSGIQSKTDKDAERLFAKQVVNPFKKLESIFIPTMDKSKGSTPKNILSFNKTSSMSVKETTEEEHEKELISEIDYRASSETAYDGDKLYMVVVDEIGKSDKANVYKRHYILKPCLIVGKKIIGKMLATSTVEDIGDSDKYDEGNFRRIWDESNHEKKDPLTNRTLSGLYRYFLPSDRSIEWDKYGMPDVESNREYLLNERKSKSSNPSELVNHMRRFPLTWEEAFYTPGDECIYNVLTIEKQKSLVESINESDLIVRGNLHWKDNVRGSGVVFTETPKGRLAFNKKFDVRAECLKVNSIRDHNGNWKPLFKKLRCIGVDPFDHATITDQYAGSKAAAYLYFKYNPMDPLSESFVCEYLHRPEDLEDFHEDITMLAFLTGAEVIIENQKQMLLSHMIKTGFKDFVYHHGTTPGVPASPKNQKLLAAATEVYIDNNIEKTVFINLLYDWSKFNLKKTTKFDAAMGAGWALVGAYDERIVSLTETEKAKPVIYEASDFY